MNRSTGITLIGVILIIAGALALAFDGIPYTSREVVLSVGDVNATAETQKNIPIPPIVSALTIAGGVLLVIVGVRKR